MGAVVKQPVKVSSPEAFGPALRALRLAKGWTLEKVYQESGVQPSCLSNWENGQNVPSLKSLFRVLAVYGRALFLGEVGGDDDGAADPAS